LGDDYTVPQRKIYHEVEEVKEGRKKRGQVSNFQDFLDLAVKKFCGSSLGRGEISPS
jgi:hypothetical protein